MQLEENPDFDCQKPNSLNKHIKEIVEKRMLQHRKNDRFNSLEKTRQNNYLNAVIEAKLEEVESRFKDGSEENMSRMIEYYIKNELGNQNAEYEEIE